MEKDNQNCIKCLSYFKEEQAEKLFYTCLDIIKNNKEFTLVTIDDADEFINIIKEKDKDFHNTYFCSDLKNLSRIPRIINQHDFVGNVPVNKNIIILGWNVFSEARKYMIKNKIEEACNGSFTKNIAIFTAHMGEDSIREIDDFNFIKEYKNLNDFKKAIQKEEYESLVKKHRNHIALIEELSVYDNCDFIFK